MTGARQHTTTRENAEPALCDADDGTAQAMIQPLFPQLAVWIGVGFITLAMTCRAISVKVPVFDWDEYAFALVARDVLHGILPYSGVFDSKPVGLIYLFAIAEWMGGQTVFALRAVGFVASAATGGILYQSCRQLKLVPALGVAIIPLFLFLVVYKDGWASMSELVACPFLALANYLVVQGGWRRRWFLLGFGAVFSVACEITYLAIPCLAFMAPGILLLGEHKTVSARLFDAMLMAVGFGVLTALIWMPQLLSGAWPSFIAQQLQYHEHYRADSSSLMHWLRHFIMPLGLLCLPALGALGLRAWREHAIPSVFSAPFCVISLEVLGASVAAAASNRMAPHYFILALPGIALLTAMMFARSAERTLRFGIIFLLLVVAVLAVWQVGVLRTAIRTPSFDKQAAVLVDRYSNVDQGIFVFDETPAIYFLSQRKTVSRYVFPTHYIPSFGGTPQITPSAVLAQALARHPALLAVGFLEPVDLDIGAIAREAGFHIISRMDLNGRSLVLYAPVVSARCCFQLPTFSSYQ